MHTVTIKIQDGVGPLSHVTEVKVTNTTTAAALAGALAAVMPKARIEWAALIRAARTVQAASGRTARPTTFPPPPPPGASRPGPTRVASPGPLGAEVAADLSAALRRSFDASLPRPAPGPAGGPRGRLPELADFREAVTAASRVWARAVVRFAEVASRVSASRPGQVSPAAPAVPRAPAGLASPASASASASRPSPAGPVAGGGSSPEGRGPESEGSPPVGLAGEAACSPSVSASGSSPASGPGLDVPAREAEPGPSSPRPAWTETPAGE